MPTPPLDGLAIRGKLPYLKLLEEALSRPGQPLRFVAVAAAA
jgi:hypothetical protein